MMRATIKAGAFRTAVNKATAATEYRNTIPVLGCVRLTVGDGSISICASNLDQMVTVSCPTLSGDTGSVCVDARRLARFLRHLPADETLTLRLKGDRLNLELPFGRLAMMTVPADAFPADLMQGRSLGQPIEILASDLHGVFSRIAPFMNSEEIRYYLCGVLLEQQSSEIVCVATTGTMLAVIPMDQPSDPIGKRRPIIPSAAVRFLINHMPRVGAASIHFDADFRHALFSVDGLTVATKLIDGTFPDYGRVIPTGPTTALDIGLSGTLSKLKLVNTFGVNSASCRIAEQRDGRLALLARSFDVGEMAFALPLAHSSREPGAAPIAFNVNPRLLTTVLQAARGDQVTLEIREHGAPIAIRGADEAIIVLMPMRGDDMKGIMLPEGAVAC